MVEFTFFEIHLDGAEFTANAPFSSADAEDAEDADWDDFDVDADTDGSGPNPGAAVFAVVIKKVFGGGEDEE
jgi:hypothetical protein